VGRDEFAALHQSSSPQRPAVGQRNPIHRSWTGGHDRTGKGTITQLFRIIVGWC